jgi:hypothetical protein
MARRFSFAMPGRFGPGDSWFRIGTVDVTSTLLVILLSAASMVVYAIDKVFLANLVLFPDLVRNGEVWRVVTWPLYNEPDIWTALTLYIFWILGSEVERLLGRNRFMSLLLGITLISGLVATGLNLTAFGIRPVELTIFVLFAIEFPHARFFFGIPARALAAVIVALDVLAYTGDRNYDALWFTFVILLAGVVLMRAFGFANDLPWIPRIPLPGQRRAAKPKRSAPPKASRKQAKGRKGTPHLTVAPPPTPASSLPDDIDRLLDKIAAEGIGSLTPEERARLDQASRRMRDERG